MRVGLVSCKESKYGYDWKRARFSDCTIKQITDEMSKYHDVTILSRLKFLEKLNPRVKYEPMQKNGKLDVLLIVDPYGMPVASTTIYRALYVARYFDVKLVVDMIKDANYNNVCFEKFYNTEAMRLYDETRSKPFMWSKSNRYWSKYIIGKFKKPLVHRSIYNCSEGFEYVFPANIINNADAFFTIKRNETKRDVLPVGFYAGRISGKPKVKELDGWGLKTHFFCPRLRQNHIDKADLKNFRYKGDLKMVDIPKRQNEYLYSICLADEHVKHKGWILRRPVEAVLAGVPFFQHKDAFDKYYGYAKLTGDEPCFSMSKKEIINEIEKVKNFKYRKELVKRQWNCIVDLTSKFYKHLRTNEWKIWDQRSGV